MKLLCDVIVINRQLSNLNVGNAPRRPLRSTLAFGKEIKDKNAYFILHFNSVNKSGFRYKVNGNIEQVFTKFCNEGKATIRFKNPPNDLCIKSEESQLKSFLNVLKLALEGNTETLKQYNLSNVTATEVIIIYFTFTDLYNVSSCGTVLCMVFWVIYTSMI